MFISYVTHKIYGPQTTYLIEYMFKMNSIKDATVRSLLPI